MQYIQPQDHEKLFQVEFLVIDEAASIQSPVVKALLGRYLVFIFSTMNGYEGIYNSIPYGGSFVWAIFNVYMF